jgi:HEAT repeat protein
MTHVASYNFRFTPEDLTSSNKINRRSEMKKNLNTIIKRNFALLLTVMLVVLTMNMYAQGDKVKSEKPNETAIKNLITAINSDNEGLRRSAVYFAGKYKVKETVNSLAEILKKEKDPNNRVLIALALFEIGDEEGINAVKKLAENDEDLYVRRMSLAIVNR